jgi:hypothetical protein
MTEGPAYDFRLINALRTYGSRIHFNETDDVGILTLDEVGNAIEIGPVADDIAHARHGQAHR